MQKKIYWILLSFLLSSSALAVSAPFNGFYVDGVLGVMTSHVKDEQSFIFPVIFDTGAGPELQEDIDLSQSSTVSKHSLTGGLGLGYAGTLKQFFYALEGRANADNNKTIFNSMLTDFVPDKISATGIHNTNVKLMNDFNLLLKLGYLFQPNTVFYGMIGPAWGHFNIATNASFSENIMDGFLTVNSSVSDNQSGYKTGLLLGLGMEYLMTKHLSLGIEYAHTDYNKLNLTQPLAAPVVAGGSFAFIVVDSTFTYNNTVRASFDDVVLRLTYYI